MANESLIGRQLANFRIERLLGRGGMAEVYFGHDVNLQRPVAIKVIDARFRGDSGYAERFVSEARAVASWRHENIVQVYYADKNHDLYYFVMEYIDGMDLDSLLREYAEAGELMPHADVVQIGKAVASALDYAHRRDVIHRDVKPANVMISTDERVVLMDFGLALDVQQGSIGEVFGTPHYVSPEQARRSADAVPQSDVYSLGVMLYEMLTGVVPFDDPSPTAVALQHLSLPPPSPCSLNGELSEQVEAVLLKALEKTVNARYQTATALMVALEEALSHKPDMLATAELPPLPVGMAPPNRSLSGQTVSERVALNIQDRQTPARHSNPPQVPIRRTKRTAPPASPAKPKAQGKPKSRSRNRGLLLAVPVVVLLAVVIGVIVLSNRGGDAENAGLIPPTISETQADNAIVVVEETNTRNAPTVAVVLPTATAIIPTAPPFQPTDTSIPPTTTPIPPSSTPVPPTPTAIPPTTTVVPLQPTVLYPNGQLVMLFWDDNGFYWYNPTAASIRVSPLDFQALDTNGNVMRFAFDGMRWTIGYSQIEPGKCVSIELLDVSGYSRPGQCSGYNSALTLQQTSNEVFWLARDNAIQFRVLWDGQEVGRCMIPDQTCEVYVP